MSAAIIAGQSQQSATEHGERGEEKSADTPRQSRGPYRPPIHLDTVSDGGESALTGELSPISPRSSSYDTTEDITSLEEESKRIEENLRRWKEDDQRRRAQHRKTLSNVAPHSDGLGTSMAETVSDMTNRGSSFLTRASSTSSRRESGFAFSLSRKGSSRQARKGARLYDYELSDRISYANGGLQSPGLGSLPSEDTITHLEQEQLKPHNVPPTHSPSTSSPSHLHAGSRYIEHIDKTPSPDASPITSPKLHDSTPSNAAEHTGIHANGVTSPSREEVARGVAFVESPNPVASPKAKSETFPLPRDRSGSATIQASSSFGSYSPLTLPDPALDREVDIAEQTTNSDPLRSTTSTTSIDTDRTASSAATVTLNNQKSSHQVPETPIPPPVSQMPHDVYSYVNLQEPESAVGGTDSRGLLSQQTTDAPHNTTAAYANKPWPVRIARACLMCVVGCCFAGENEYEDGSNEQTGRTNPME